MTVRQVSRVALLAPDTCHAVVGRHGFILAAVNMPTGERWAYASYLLHVLMHDHKILPYIMMYDINCRCAA